jgi:hypothetical protein
MYAKAGVGEEFFPPLVKAVQHQDQNGFEAVQNMEETEEGGRSMGSTSSSKAASHADSTKSQLESNFTLFPRYGRATCMHLALTSATCKSSGTCTSD